MPVLVVGSHAYKRDLWREPCELLVRQAALAAVMGNLEEVDVTHP